MSENHSVWDTRTCLEFNAKDAEAVEDYLVDFAPMLPEGQALAGTPQITIEANGIGELSPTLVVQDPSLSAGEEAVGSPALTTAVLFWLRGGTDQVRYRGKIKVQVTTSGSPPPQRTLVKRFYIVVEGFPMTGSPEQGESAGTSPDDDDDELIDAIERV